jgi:acyl carrier protein
VSTFEKFSGLVQDHTGKTNIKETDSLVDDLDLDSLDIVELVMLSEDAFGIELLDSDLEHVFTVADAVKLIDKQSAAARNLEK